MRREATERLTVAARRTFMAKSLWLLFLLAGCGSVDGAAEPGPITELTTQAMVLESKEHGPELCLSVLESLPPQCGDIPITNWDWAAAPGEETLNGTTWGDRYVVVGTFDGMRFTLTRPVTQAHAQPADASPSELATPCPEPDGGWPSSHGDLSTEQAAAGVLRAARRLPGFGHFWLDRSTRMVINVAVTGDLTVAERALRKVWDGPLCVSTTERTEKELRRIEREVRRVDGMSSSAVGQGAVSVHVKYDDGSLQRQLDAKYGAGAVVVTSALKPYSP